MPVRKTQKICPITRICPCVVHEMITTIVTQAKPRGICLLLAVIEDPRLQQRLDKTIAAYLVRIELLIPFGEVVYSGEQAGSAVIFKDGYTDRPMMVLRFAVIRRPAHHDLAVIAMEHRAGHSQWLAQNTVGIFSQRHTRYAFDDNAQ